MYRIQTLSASVESSLSFLQSVRGAHPPPSVLGSLLSRVAETTTKALHSRPTPFFLCLNKFQKIQGFKFRYKMKIYY